MATSTPATKTLEKAGIAFELVQYDYAPGNDRVGLQAADAIGAPPGQVFKTLMVELDGKPVCAILPSDRELNMKKCAKALKGKSAAMMDPQKAERLTGYKVGGISPLGSRKRLPAALDASAKRYDTIFLNGGQRGLQVKLKPGDLIKLLGCQVEDLVR
ncbi:Cys-tRNA(Pro) deacylase [Cohaesibacter sp. CAU 1516]|uniref:Cys-tRNA(Pro) deacylase n=1 Tax=Cohaesibacter sp. CAU 1516 TaxID=2576038 RepID=UPI0010FE497B|nr:Cys-tRNA(Pro) deacylase [Cohaesibacter sp. CAU 1516]TLP48131.1 Cys-tRNA(Pro) deacylase [Cohaesibacter sp. CAU 1516]